MRPSCDPITVCLTPDPDGLRWLPSPEGQGGGDALPAALGPWFSPDPGLAGARHGWACLPADGRYWVGHFRSPGGPDSGAMARVAGWPLECCDETFDPGSCLGDLGALPRGDTCQAFVGAAEPPALALSDEDHALVAQLLAALLQGMVQGYPVVLTASAAHLAPGPALGSLVAAVALARAGLPGHLRHRCKVRLPTYAPERFLGADGADLLVVPSALAAGVLTRRRDAALLDRRGGRQAGPEPAATAVAYAVAVVRAAGRVPGGLTAFGERFDRVWDGGWPLEPGLVALVPTVFDLGLAIHGTAQQGADLFGGALVDSARESELPWSDLISAEEWSAFPEDRLVACLLRPGEGLTPGELALQRALGQAFADQGRLVDAGLDAWWDGHDGAKLRRLLALCAGPQALISPKLVAGRTAGLNLAELAAAGPIAGVLAAELEVGVLPLREAEAEVIAAQAAAPGMLDVLVIAARRGALGGGWLEHLLAQAGPADLVGVCLGLLAHPVDLPLWGDAPVRLVDALRRFHPVDPTLAPRFARSAQGLDPVAQIGLYAGLLDLVTAIEPRPGVFSAPLLARLWSALEGLAEPQARQGFINDLLGGRWACLGPGALLNQDGDLRPAWVASLPELVLSSAELTAALPLAALLKLRAPRDSAAPTWVKAVTARWERDPEGSTNALIAADLWFDWRRQTDLSLAQRRAGAFLWLAAPALVHHRAAGPEGLPPHWRRGRVGRHPMHRPPDLTLEAWRQVMADLVGGLSAQDADAISRSQTHWPWIYPWEQEQVADLQALCRDAAARAALILETPVDR